MKYDYYFTDEALATLNEEFSLEKYIQEFASKVKQTGETPAEAGEQFFAEYGEKMIGRAIELGDKYMDRQGEILKQTAEKTGQVFPHIPQRYWELMLMGTRPTAKIYVYGNNIQIMDFTIPKCPGYDLLKENIDQKTADTLPCKHACLLALKTLYEELKLDINVEMTEKMPEKPCHFISTKK
ncbi:MAG: hypothetical protein ACETWM_20260 [Candidatus Lokiarchaeia archaeon]